MNIRKLLRTKSFWGGLSQIAAGIGLAVSGEIPAGLVLVGKGVSDILRRDTDVKNEERTEELQRKLDEALQRIREPRA